ncbi:ABC transporter permease subunit [Mycoplasmopsis cricetuli]|uniref:ABC transporter permease subunit n=1 Tax=Mycoplasmopsis cricetuli TaxID=171283 RepID=UPI000472E9E4|nr:hypothetical protein [Mycoplasmopsis cricetuli]
MNKTFQIFEQLKNEVVAINENYLKQVKFENQQFEINLLDKIYKKSIQQKDRLDSIVHQINHLNELFDQNLAWLHLNIQDSELLEQKLKKLKNNHEKKIIKLKLKHKKLKQNLDLKLQNYSIKIKQKITKHKELASKHEKILEDKIVQKNKTLIQNQKKKFDIYQKELENLVFKKENQLAIALQEYEKSLSNINENYEIISQKQKQILENEYLKKIEKVEKKFQGKESKIFNKIRFLNSLKKLNNWSFYQKLDSKFYEWIIKNKLIFMIAIFALIVGSIYPKFFYYENWLNNILQQNIVIGFLAIGMTFVIITGSIDLSVGSSMALIGGITLYLHKVYSYSLAVSVVIGLIIALTISFVIGFLSSYGKLQSFIVTLVGLIVFRGLLNIILKGSPVTVIDNSFINFLGNGKILYIPSTVVVFTVVTVFLMFILKFTKLGRYIYATGSNKIAAKVSGIQTKIVTTTVFVILGMMIFLASLSYIGNVKSIEPQSANGFELSAIAAVVLGGTSLNGGKGSIGKTIIGWLLISILNNALVFLRVDANLQLVFRGVIILLAVLFDKQFNFKNLYLNFLTRIRGY